MNRIPLRDRARGRWHDILPLLGIDRRYLTGKNGPCPMCGGRDRWRFLNTDGNGTWICNQCGQRGGGGADLVMKFTGAPFYEVAQRIESVLGETCVREHRRDVRDVRDGLNRLWCGARAVCAGDATDLWLRSRGVGLDRYPPCLRTGAKVRYVDNDTAHPAMLAMVQGPDGKPVTIHRTYLTADGRKAPVDKPRKLYSAMAKGSAIRLAPVGARLGVAEGIETALAAAKLFNAPTWATISAGMLETFEPPSTVSEVVIFGDNDANHVGQRAAHALAARLAGHVRVDVKIPDLVDTDWNDVWLGNTTG
jgi:putative DNA primase/helicase